MASRRALCLPIVAALAASCGYPSFAFDGSDASLVDDGTTGAETIVVPDVSDANDAGNADVPAMSDGTIVDVTVDAGPADVPVDLGPELPPDAGCPMILGGDFCTSIPKFTASAQIVDGIPDEFCDIPATMMNATNAQYSAPSPPPSGVDTVVYTRVAWSTDALHIHAHVSQISVYTPATTEFLWHGDALEIFAAGYSPLTGSYAAGNDIGALQVIVVPPGNGGPARAKIYLEEVLVNDLDPSRWAARVVSDGYEVELELPWSELQATLTTPVSGMQIAFDVAVDVRENATNPTPLVQLVQGLQNQSPTTCAPDPAHPACDDRTWCAPTLQ